MAPATAADRERGGTAILHESSLGTQAVRRLDRWNRIVSGLFPGMTVDASPDIVAEWRGVQLGGTVVGTAWSDAATLRRRPAGERDDRLLLHIQLAGQCAYGPTGREAVARRGDLFPCRADERYGIALSRRNAVLVLDMPLAAMAAAPPRGPLAGPAVNLLGDFLRSLLRQDWTRLDPAEGAELEATVQLMAARAWRVPGPRMVSPDRIVLDRIDAHLGDGALNLATVATLAGVDAQAVRGVLAARGTTLAAHLLDRRLALAAERLARDGARASVTMLAHDLGFSDAAHFCRRFKARFGASPGRWARAPGARVQ